jgi:phage tail sheath gpL-like
MAAPIIPITGIDAGFRLPGAFAEVLFAQGPASAAAGVRDVCFVMPKTSAGSWTAATRYRVGNEQDAITGAGPGSPLHRAIRKFLRINKDARVWAVPVAETASGSPVAASATVTFATQATGTGTATVTICGEDCSLTFASGTSVTDIAAGMKAVINDKFWLPVTADNSSGVLTITAKLKGISQGTASLGVIRIRASITPGVGTTVSTSGDFLGTDDAGADGSTTEAANFLTALSALDSTRHYYIVSSSNDATSWGHLKTHIQLKSEPKRGLRSIGIVGYTGSLASCQTLATGRNYERLNVIQQINSDHDCAELAGAWAAIRQKGEAVDTATNFDSYRLDPHILPAFSTSDWPDADDQNDAINDGITIIASDPVGAYVVMSVNTRSKNAAGTQDDFRATETHRVSVADEFTDELLALWNLSYAGQKLKDDQRLADGSVNPNQRLIRGVLTPSQLVSPIKKQMTNYELLGKLQNTEETKESVRVVKNGSRLESGFDLTVIDHAHQATFRIAETSTG